MNITGIKEQAAPVKNNGQEASQIAQLKKELSNVNKEIKKQREQILTAQKTGNSDLVNALQKKIKELTTKKQNYEQQIKALQQEKQPSIKKKEAADTLEEIESVEKTKTTKETEAIKTKLLLKPSQFDRYEPKKEQPDNTYQVINEDGQKKIKFKSKNPLED